MPVLQQLLMQVVTSAEVATVEKNNSAKPPTRSKPRKVSKSKPTNETRREPYGLDDFKSLVDDARLDGKPKRRKTSTENRKKDVYGANAPSSSVHLYPQYELIH